MAIDPNKASIFNKRYMARSERKQQRALAQDWGKDRGISRDQNQLLWNSRQQHDDIAKWLAAAAWNDASGATAAANWQGPVTPQHPQPAPQGYTAGVDPNHATMGPSTLNADPRLRGAGYWRSQTGHFLDQYKNGLEGLDYTEEMIMRRRMQELMAHLQAVPRSQRGQSLRGLNYYMHNTLGDAGLPITD